MAGNIDSMKYAAASGILLGLGAFFIKMPLSTYGFLLSALVLSPFTWIALILSVTGFVFMQKSFHSGFISVSVPLLSGISIAIPVILANIFLSEVIPIAKWLSIGLILLGVFGFAFCQRYK